MNNVSRRTLAWSLLPDDWRQRCREAEQPAFRAPQIWQWLYVKRIRSWEAMTNLPARWREELASHYEIEAWRGIERRQASDGVVKLLLTCRDGEAVESVLIPTRDRLTLCVSTQVGCSFGCAFCATGQDGLARNLDAGEIVGQAMAAMDAPNVRRLTHIVFMGMGEPFDNYDQTLRAVRVLNDFDGLGIGARRMTISTCGVVPGIRRLAGEGLQVELSISLHAPDDELRSRLMPVNRRWPLPELFQACDDYSAGTGRIVTYEYTLVSGLNDAPEQARTLAGRLRERPCRVNLIPLSPVEGFDGLPPEPDACDAFADILRQAGLNVTLRHSRGIDLDAACGQLRRHALRSQANEAAEAMVQTEVSPNGSPP